MLAIGGLLRRLDECRRTATNSTVFVDKWKDVVGADFGSQWIEWRATIIVQELDQALLGTRSVEKSAEAACAAIDQVLGAIEKP